MTHACKQVDGSRASHIMTLRQDMVVACEAGCTRHSSKAMLHACPIALRTLHRILVWDAAGLLLLHLRAQGPSPL